MSIRLEVTGGEGLDELRAVMMQAGGGRLVAEVAHQSAEAIGSLVDQSFAAGRGPNGDEWKPLKCRDGTPLTVSGALKQSAKPRADGGSLVVDSNLPYSRVQQRGATIRATSAKALRFVCHGQVIFRKQVKIPARRFVPAAAKLPPEWDAKVREAAEKVLREALPGDATNYT